MVPSIPLAEHQPAVHAGQWMGQAWGMVAAWPIGTASATVSSTQVGWARPLHVNPCPLCGAMELPGHIVALLALECGLQGLRCPQMPAALHSLPGALEGPLPLWS